MKTKGSTNGSEYLQTDWICAACGRKFRALGKCRVSLPENNCPHCGGKLLSVSQLLQYPMRIEKVNLEEGAVFRNIYCRSVGRFDTKSSSYTY